MTWERDRESGPADFLVEVAGLLPAGRVLDVAAGSGRNAVYLAKRGFDVEGVDISEEAVAEALAATREAGVSLDMRVVDLEAGRYIQKDAYDIIVCFNYLQRSLMPQIKEGIRRGGMAVYETYIVDQARFGRPRSPDHLLKYNELLDVFRDFRCLRYREGVFGDRAIASILAQKV